MAQSLTDEDIRGIKQEIKQVKDTLKAEIDSNADLYRKVRPEALNPNNVVSLFDSNLTRCLGMNTATVNDELLIVKVYYFGVAENIIKNGFEMNGEKYVFFSASAGQIRTKRFVAIKESAYNACMNTLTCGLSLDKINERGGVNVNKYLAYLALCNSATTVWNEFDIDKTIVINDFATEVNGMVDFIDEKDFSITRQQQDVPIEHSDGCGMVLPSVSKKNFMIRAPWVKGLLVSFPFDKFIREANRKDTTVNHGLITDIYGQQHDVIAEGIQVIFTKSQMKMYKYYSSWKEYQTNFKKYGCTAGKCNEEPDHIPPATFNYQMLQTLVDMTDEELAQICANTNTTLRNMTRDRATMLRVFGADGDEDSLSPLQKCLAYYPELLQDAHCKELLRSLRNSIELKAVAGKLKINGKYLFLIPDMYAACEQWFLGIKTPTGLLQNGEVFCRIYRDEPEMDVLRSPHLYKEHAVRRNVYHDNQEARRWFRTDGIYTSSYDLISKILQFDNDGDKALVCVDKTIIEVAKRNCADVVPLYYPMAKAAAQIITPEVKYEGMMHAWTGGNIGIISNQISKIWGSEHPDEDAVKVLVMQNNFVIDYAKTLYKPTIPKEWETRIHDLTNGKLPRFFLYAKDKELTQVDNPNACVVNRLVDKIQSYKFDFQKKQLGVFDYKMLMRDPNIEVNEKTEQIIKTYREMASVVTQRKESSMDSPYINDLKNIASTLSQYGTKQYVADVLVKYLFGIHMSKHKAVFWDIYGEIVYQNLKANHAGDGTLCQRCGKRFAKLKQGQCLCKECSEATTYIPEDPFVATCFDCGKEFIPEDIHQTRCPVCQWMLDNPVVTNNIALCESCGAPFDVVTKRGKKARLCRRCKRLHIRQSHRENDIRRALRRN